MNPRRIMLELTLEETRALDKLLHKELFNTKHSVMRSITLHNVWYKVSRSSLKGANHG